MVGRKDFTVLPKTDAAWLMGEYVDVNKLERGRTCRTLPSGCPTWSSTFVTGLLSTERKSIWFGQKMRQGRHQKKTAWRRDSLHIADRSRLGNDASTSRAHAADATMSRKNGPSQHCCSTKLFSGCFFLLTIASRCVLKMSTWKGQLENSNFDAASNVI